MLGVFITAAALAGVPASLVIGECSAESDFRAITNHQDGGSASLGKCQVKQSTAWMLGYRGTPEELLNDDSINAYYAAKYLRYQLDRYEYRFCDAIAAYNAGSVKRSPDGTYRNKKYVVRVLGRWRKYAGGELPISKRQLEHCRKGTGQDAQWLGSL